MIDEIRTIKITEKGQIVIPKRMRLLKGFSTGSIISIISHDNKIELKPQEQINDVLLTHLASEKVLAKDWNTKEEDKAWKDL